MPGRLPDKTELKKPVKDEPVPQPEPELETAYTGAGRWLWLAGVAAVLAVVVGLVVARPWESRSASPQSSTADSSNEIVGNAGGQGDNLPPGRPHVTATRIDATTVRFSWTYSAQLDSDTFLWRDAAAGAPHVVSHPTVDIKSSAGRRICIAVKVVRADGSYGTVAWSDEGCGS
jgi:hypothetical protein